MNAMKEGKIDFTVLREHFKNKIDLSKLRQLYTRCFDKRNYVRNKSLAVIYSLCGIHSNMIANFLFLYKRTIRKQIAKYYKQGFWRHLYPRNKKNRIYELPEIQNAVFSVLHSPPILYDINRTTWTVKLIQQIVNKQGYKIGRTSVDRIIRNAGYRFRKAREVLTSNDPDYSEKLGIITNILQKLGAHDRFFSIDEFGSFAIKKKGGRQYVQQGEHPTILKWQKSKGVLIIVAAIELSTNQITHFYSLKKDSEEVLKLLEILVQKYSGCRTIYLSWDAASWHSSNVVLDKKAEVTNTVIEKSIILQL